MTLEGSQWGPFNFSFDSFKIVIHFYIKRFCDLWSTNIILNFFNDLSPLNRKTSTNWQTTSWKPIIPKITVIIQHFPLLFKFSILNSVLERTMCPMYPMSSLKTICQIVSLILSANLFIVEMDILFVVPLTSKTNPLSFVCLFPTPFRNRFVSTKSNNPHHHHQHHHHQHFLYYKWSVRVQQWTGHASWHWHWRSSRWTVSL